MKDIVSCLRFEKGKTRRVKVGVILLMLLLELILNISRLFSDSYMNNCMKRAEKTAIYYDDGIKYSGMKQRKTSISADGNVAT